MSNSQIARHVVEHSEMIFQDVRKNSFHPYIKQKAARTRVRLRQQSKADHQGSKFLSTEIRRVSPFIFKDAPSINNCFLRNFGTNRKQVLLRLRLRPFIPILNLRTTTQKWKPGRLVIKKHNDSYVTAWESEQAKTIFDNAQDEPDQPNSPIVLV